MSTQLNQSIETVVNHLELIEKNQILRLDFKWKGTDIHAFVEQKGEESHIIIRAVLGKLFYTVENADNRSNLLKNYYEIKRKDGSTTYSMVKKQEIHFKSITVAPSITDEKSLVEALTYILLDHESELEALISDLKPVN